MGAQQVGGFSREGLRGGEPRSPRPEASANILDDAILFNSRVATRTQAGANLTIPAEYGYGEVQELRYASSISNAQIQAYFVQVQQDVANSSTVRAAEFVARQGTAVAIGELVGLHAQAQARSSGNLTFAAGIHAQLSVFSGYTGTVTKGAAVRAKVQSEGTMTEVYGVLIENEYVTGGVTLAAAIGVEATNQSTTSFTAIIDSRDARTAVHDTDRVTLWIFKNDVGANIRMSYDTSGNALVFDTI